MRIGLIRNGEDEVLAVASVLYGEPAGQAESPVRVLRQSLLRLRECWAFH